MNSISLCAAWVSLLSLHTLVIAGSTTTTTTTTTRPPSTPRSETIIEFSIDQGPYVSDYHRICRTTAFKPLPARKYCTDKGPHWHSAHLAFQKVLPEYYAEVKSRSPSDYRDFTWYSANDEAKEGDWVYEGAASAAQSSTVGRTTRQTSASGGDAASTRRTNFARGVHTSPKMAHLLRQRTMAQIMAFCGKRSRAQVT